MDGRAIVELVLSFGIAIIGYFLKIIHSDIKSNTENVGKNAGRITQLSKDIEHEKELRSQSFAYIKEILEEIREELKTIKK